MSHNPTLPGPASFGGISPLVADHAVLLLMRQFGFVTQGQSVFALELYWILSRCWYCYLDGYDMDIEEDMVLSTLISNALWSFRLPTTDDGKTGGETLG